MMTPSFRHVCFSLLLLLLLSTKTDAGPEEDFEKFHDTLMRHDKLAVLYTGECVYEGNIRYDDQLFDTIVFPTPLPPPPPLPPLPPKIYQRVIQPGGYCFENIIFRPYSTDLVEIIVTGATGHTIDISYTHNNRKHAVLTCDGTGKVTVKGSSKLFLESNVAFKKKNSGFNTCQSIIIDQKDFVSQMDTITWTYVSTGDTRPKNMNGKMSKTILEEKLQCDPTRIVLTTPASYVATEDHSEKLAKLTTREIVLGNETIGNILSLEVPEKVNCTQGTLRYLIGAVDNGVGYATGISCVTNTYNIKKYGAARGSFDVQFKDTINVVCVDYHCKKCKEPLANACPQHIECAKVVQNTFDSFPDKCFELNFGPNKMARYNGDKYANVENKIVCDTDGKYKLDGNVIENITVTNQYDFQSAYSTKFKSENPPFYKGEQMRTPACDTKGCHCYDSDTPHLAIATINAKYGDGWRRIEKLTFNRVLNQWEYEKKVKQDGNVKSFNYVLPKDANVQCVESMVKKRKTVPNENVSTVYIVNLVLLVVIAIGTVVGSILFVNARVKKREELKARKGKKGESKTDDKSKTKEGESKDKEEKA